MGLPKKYLKFMKSGGERPIFFLRRAVLLGAHRKKVGFGPQTEKTEPFHLVAGETPAKRYSLLVGTMENQ